MNVDLIKNILQNLWVLARQITVTAKELLIMVGCSEEAAHRYSNGYKDKITGEYFIPKRVYSKALQYVMVRRTTI